MGELLGIPEWLAMLIFVSLFLLILGSVAWRNTNCQIKETLAKRDNPTRSEFIKMMNPDVSMEASEFIWDSAVPCLDFFKTQLTPHPEDDLVGDLPIDGDEWSLDWPREWAEQQGFHDNNFPDWPEDWPATIRNFGKWLDMAPQS